MARGVQWEIRLPDHGVRLPSEDWVDVPDCPFQVKTQAEDLLGSFWVRVKPDYRATWAKLIPDADHLILCENPDCPGCM